jgi:hypothetical protein
MMKNQIEKPHRIVNGVRVDLTAEEILEIERDEEANISRIEGKRIIDYRVLEYLSIGDQLDMLYKDKRDGTSDWFDHIDAIKKKYPKPVV